MLLLSFSSFSFGNASIVKELPNELVVEASAKYVLGDNDSRIDARNIALNEAKRAASEIAGTQVKSELVVENDQILKDQINIVTASFMTVEITHEIMNITPDRRSEIEITIRAKLDKTAIQAKMNTYRGDVNRKKELGVLQTENARLQKELETLNSQLSSIRNNDIGTVTQKPRSELVARRDVIISSLEENQGQVRRVFEKGTLLSLAKHSDSNFEEAVRTINEGVYGYIKSNTKIALGDPEFRDNHDGTFDVYVAVTWSVDKKPPLKVLNQYFNIDSTWQSDERHDVFFNSFENNEGKQKNSLGSKLFSKALNKRLVIQVNIGNKKTKITTGRKYTDYDNYSRFEINFSGTGHNDKFEELAAEQNPVVIRKVPASVLQNSSAINAELIVE